MAAAAGRSILSAALVAVVRVARRLVAAGGGRFAVSVRAAVPLRHRPVVTGGRGPLVAPGPVLPVTRRITVIPAIIPRVLSVPGPVVVTVLAVVGRRVAVVVVARSVPLGRAPVLLGGVVLGLAVHGAPLLLPQRVQLVRDVRVLAPRAVAVFRLRPPGAGSVPPVPAVPVPVAVSISVVASRRVTVSVSVVFAAVPAVAVAVPVVASGGVAVVLVA